MSTFEHGPRIAHGPDIGGAPGGEGSIEIPEIVAQRVDFLKQHDPLLTIGAAAGSGSTSVAYDCRFRDETPRILKVSKMSEGIAGAEVYALNTLLGVTGIPRLAKVYEQNGINIALVVEKITGTEVKDYIAGRKEGIVDVFVKIRAVIEEVHRHGFLMPRD